jgi:hypothetical protein
VLASVTDYSTVSVNYTRFHSPSFFGFLISTKGAATMESLKEVFFYLAGVAGVPGGNGGLVSTSRLRPSGP